MATWFVFNEWQKTIKPVEVIKSSDHFVTLAGDPNSFYSKEPRRHAMRGTDSYFTTFVAAKEFAVEWATRKVKYAKEELHKQQSALGQIESLQEPEAK